MKKFLTEESLGVILRELYKEVEPQYILPTYCNKKKRVDYAVFLKKDEPRPSDLNEWASCDKNIILLFEFDGSYHYTNDKNVVEDYWFDDNPFSNITNSFDLSVTTASKLGLNWKYVCSFDMGTEEETTVCLMRIPYWIQLTSEISQLIFGINTDFSNGFPHGFIEKKCILPSRFSYLGLTRFIYELVTLPYNIAQDVLKSLLSPINRKPFRFLEEVLPFPIQNVLHGFLFEMDNFIEYNTVENSIIYYLSLEDNVNDLLTDGYKTTFYEGSLNTLRLKNWFYTQYSDKSEQSCYELLEKFDYNLSEWENMKINKPLNQ